MESNVLRVLVTFRRKMERRHNSTEIWLVAQYREIEPRLF